MKVKYLLTANCIIGFLFGAGFTLLPGLCCSLMGFEVVGDSTLIAQGMGVFVLGTGVLTLLARNAPESEAKRAILLSLLILYSLLVMYKASLNVFAGIPFNLMFAVIYVIHAVLIAGYAYCLFRTPRVIQS